MCHSARRLSVFLVWLSNPTGDILINLFAYYFTNDFRPILQPGDNHRANSPLVSEIFLPFIIATVPCITTLDYQYTYIYIYILPYSNYPTAQQANPTETTTMQPRPNPHHNPRLLHTPRNILLPRQSLQSTAYPTITKPLQSTLLKDPLPAATQRTSTRLPVD